ncbi:MAG: hypothetical protein ACJ77M_06270 [Thermoleophilaceae bacterium]|jgi:hypothetical protein
MTEHRQTTPPETDPPTGPPPGWEDWARAANGAATGGPQLRQGIPELVSALMAIADALRRAIPHELQEQFAALQRELLLTIRALIDWYLERLDGASRAPQVEDIPID